ncbi:hypothetical protein ACFP1Z_10370 [Streptomyces gamaensis]|uniref:Uncharacterized protein n=1 Tax=Streptomyces gamaensis TaxID=1763542 RepID=A0ABW0Z1Q0_9ACTN
MSLRPPRLLEQKVFRPMNYVRWGGGAKRSSRVDLERLCAGG